MSSYSYLLVVFSGFEWFVALRNINNIPVDSKAVQHFNQDVDARANTVVDDPDEGALVLMCLHVVRHTTSLHRAMLQVFSEAQMSVKPVSVDHKLQAEGMKYTLDFLQSGLGNKIVCFQFDHCEVGNSGSGCEVHLGTLKLFTGRQYYLPNFL